MGLTTLRTKMQELGVALDKVGSGSGAETDERSSGRVGTRHHVGLSEQFLSLEVSFYLVCLIPSGGGRGKRRTESSQQPTSQNIRDDRDCRHRLRHVGCGGDTLIRF